jgi:hypothetical protein
MEKLQYENDNFIIYSPDSLKYITDRLPSILNISFEFYKELFDIDTFRKVQINYFDDINKFREYIYSLRGEKTSLPRYAQGTFDNGMINSYIAANWVVGSPMYNIKLYMASHELFHIMYQELIWQKEGLPRITWFDEGMAQLFSGENNNNLSSENFEKWFNMVIAKTKVIPNLNELNHGNGFETEDYSGYHLSLLSVKYLFDILPAQEFKNLMHDTEKINEYGKIVVESAFKYYNEKLKRKGGTLL